nr:hypothetical protein [Bacteroidaceae bacterium]
VSLGTKDGGCFSIAFWNEVLKREFGDGKADWASLMDETIRGTLQYSSNKQEPVYRIENNDVPAPIDNISTVNNGNVVVIAVGENELREAFKQIIDPNSSNSERWDMVSGITGRLFAHNAMVTVVGRDLRTNVGQPVSIKEYLEDLALSKRVKGINIVRAKKNGNGKYSLIVVSEIR